MHDQAEYGSCVHLAAHSDLEPYSGQQDAVALPHMMRYIKLNAAAATYTVPQKFLQRDSHPYSCEWQE